HGLDILGRRDVRTNRERLDAELLERPDRGLGALLVLAVVDADPRTPTPERERRRPPDATRRAGDQRNASFEILRHRQCTPNRTSPSAKLTGSARAPVQRTTPAPHTNPAPIAEIKSVDPGRSAPVSAAS